MIVAVGVNTDVAREMLGMTTGQSEAEPFWVEFLRGTKLVISDEHEGLKAAITKILSATRQWCRVHFIRNALAYARKTQRRIVLAWIGTAFAQDDAEVDVLAVMGFAPKHRAKIHSTNPIQSNGSTARSSAAAMSSAFFQMRPPSSG